MPETDMQYLAYILIIEYNIIGVSFMCAKHFPKFSRNLIQLIYHQNA